MCYYALQMYVLLGVINLFPLERWFPSSARTRSTGSGTISTQKEVLDIRQFLLDYYKQKELAEGIGIEEDDSEDLGNDL